MNKKVSVFVVVTLLLSGFSISQTGLAADASIKGLKDKSNQRAANVQQNEYSQRKNNKQGVPVGQFRAILDGVNLKNRAIWLNDYRYKLYPGYKAVDKQSQPINLSSIPSGGQVYVVIKENVQEPITPYLVKLIYQK
jgi:hypothetical protein